MAPIEQKMWRAGRFWWDWPHPSSVGAQPVKSLSAVVFDLAAIADLESAGHRVAFNAAFAAHGLDIEWSVPRYRQLLALPDERRRVAAELRKRGVSTESDVLAEQLVGRICATKAMLLDETILEADIAPRSGVVELITEAYGAGVSVGVVSTGSNSWVDPLVRQLVGDGVVSAVVTPDDAPGGHLLRQALAELDASAFESLAFAGSPAMQRMAASVGLPTVLLTGPAAVAPLRMVDCQRVYDQWWETHAA